jgi:hypothetical protein
MPNQMAPNTKRITFCANVVEDMKLERLASEVGLNKSELIRQAVREFLDKNFGQPTVQLQRSASKSACVRSRYSRRPRPTP